MTASLNYRITLPPAPQEETSPPKETSIWGERTWEICKEAAVTSLPFLTLYKPLSFPVALASGGLRVGVSVLQLGVAIKEGKIEEILSASLQTTVAVISLAGTIFAHPIGLLISTGYDLILEVKNLIKHLHEGDYKKALQSCLKISGHCLYLAVFAYGGPELMIAYCGIQILIAVAESYHEFKEGHYIAGIGHALMTLVRGNQMVGQIQALQLKMEIQRLLKDSSYIGKLADKWQFPSDHLPVGAKVGNVRVLSWNILNSNYIDWVIEKDSQGLRGSLISELEALPSQKYPGSLSMREEFVLDRLLEVMNDPEKSSHLIFALQECKPELVSKLREQLPSHIGIVFSDPALRLQDQNLTIYNKNDLTYLPNESAIVEAFPNSSPGRTLMDMTFSETGTDTKFRVINTHSPGDPTNPGTWELTKYLLRDLRSDCTTVAVGDMNFTEAEMQLGFDRAATELHRPSPFKNHVDYNTNVGPYQFEGKSIDHVWINTSLNVEKLKPNEVLPDLQKTVDLLHPAKDPLEYILDVLNLEALRKWYHDQQLLLQQNRFLL